MSKRICIFGTSITRGSWDPEGGGWVNRLRRYIELGMESKKIKDDILLYNLGISADTTDGMLKRFASEFKPRAREYAENIIIFDMGINDSAFRKSLNRNFVTKEKYKKNLEALYKKSQKIADKIVFIGLSNLNEQITVPAPWAIDFYYYYKNAEEYNILVKKFCKKNRILFIDIFGILRNSDLEDGLHPNSAGHEKIFQRVKDYLVENKII